MADDLHCPQCKTRIHPYEHESNDKMTKGNVIPACWNCGLPMETVLRLNEQGIRELGAPRVTLSQAEQEIADLRAEVARLKDVQIRPPTEPPIFPPASSEEYGEEHAPAPAHEGQSAQSLTIRAGKEEVIPLAIASPPKPHGHVSETEAATKDPPPIKWKNTEPAAPHRGPGRPAGSGKK